MMMNMETNKKRKAQSQTQTPTKNPHQDQQQEDQKCEETINDHKPIILPYLPPLYYRKYSGDSKSRPYSPATHLQELGSPHLHPRIC
ncbi:hypothetical protein LguiA_033461 [Lonicera macranthoides]